jgi:uncharacterized protein (TIGR02118 family)
VLKLTVLYGPPKDVDAFEEYYAKTHMPLVHKIPGLGRIEMAKIVGTPDGSAPPYHRIFEFWFDDQAHLNRTMGSPEGRAASADLQNFATGGATIVVSQVEG